MASRKENGGCMTYAVFDEGQTLHGDAEEISKEFVPRLPKIMMK